MTHWTTLTGAGALVVDDRRMLLVQQRRPYGVHWEFPSGYYESGESFDQTAAREVLEETAVPVEIRDLLCTMVWERTNDRRQAVLDRWAADDRRPFHLHVDVSVNPDGTQSYAVRP